MEIDLIIQKYNNRLLQAREASNRYYEKHKEEIRKKNLEHQREKLKDEEYRKK